MRDPSVFGKLSFREHFLQISFEDDRKRLIRKMFGQCPSCRMHGPHAMPHQSASRARPCVWSLAMWSAVMSVRPLTVFGDSSRFIRERAIMASRAARQPPNVIMRSGVLKNLKAICAKRSIHVRILLQRPPNKNAGETLKSYLFESYCKLIHTTSFRRRFLRYVSSVQIGQVKDEAGR